MESTAVRQEELVNALEAFVDESVVRAGGSTLAVRPAHRVRFNWPPHPVSHDYRVSPRAWTGHGSFEAYGDRFTVVVAKTPYGVFGRCEELWLEARGTDEDSMLWAMRSSAEPLFQRQLIINKTLHQPGRFAGSIREASAECLLKLLYCEDRDVAAEARTEIEKRASAQRFLLPLVSIIEDRRHPHRRSAQWCVLDLFEDLDSFVESDDERQLVVSAIERLIVEAEDDFARAIFKAGTVLGGHLPATLGGQALIRCLGSAGPIGRRAAIHGLYHVVEWFPDHLVPVVSILREHSVREMLPELAAYAHAMARDIENGDPDHVLEPFFDGEEASVPNPYVQVSLP